MGLIRVLHIVSGMGMGGIETFLINLYRFIDKDRIQFDFVIHKAENSGFENEIIQQGGRIYYFKPYLVYNTIRYCKEVKCFLRTHQEYKVIHVHQRKVSTIWAYIGKRENRTIAIHSHSTTNGYGFKGIIENFLQYGCRFFGDYFFGCSQEACDWMFGRHIASSDKCFVVKNGIDLDKFQYSEQNRKEIRSEFRIQEDVFVIGAIGRLVPQKNYSFMLKIYSKIQISREKTKLLIVGDGPLRKKMVDEINNYSIENNVILAGTRIDAYKFLSAFDTFVMTSSDEGLGIAAIEAQANGLLVTVSDAIPESAKVLDTMIRLPLNVNEEEWVSSILRGNKNNERKSIENHVLLSQYDIRNTAEWIVDLYQIMANSK